MTQIQVLKTETAFLQKGLSESLDQANIKVANVTKHSTHDSDEVSLVLIENENLKRKIKILEMDSVKQNKLEKLNQQINEKEQNIKNLQETLKNSQTNIV